MHVAYKPADGDAQSWDFDPRRIPASRAEMIETRFDGTFDEWVVGVQQGLMRARRVLLWHLLSARHPTLKIGDVPDFMAGELEVSYDVDELRPMRESIEQATMPESKRSAALAAIDRMLTEAMAREDAAAGKDPAASEHSLTSGG